MRTTAKTARPALKLEALEARDVPAILIQLDYSRDTTGFFNNPEARATLEQVANEIGSGLTANLAAITPSGTNTYTASFFDPATGGVTSVSNLSIAANTIKVYVGARNLTGTEAGFGGFGGYSVSGTQAFLNTVQGRGHTGFAPAVGSITFDVDQNWHFGATTAGLDANELDFRSVAEHELGHVLGLGTAPQFKNLVSGGAFRGANAMSVYGGAVPLNAGGDHWADGLTVNGRPASLDPSLSYGQRVEFSALDRAALTDLGWNTPSAAAAASPPPAAAVPNGVTVIPVAQNNGTIKQTAVVNGQTVATGAVFTPFPGYTGPLTQAYGDFNNDGVYDVAVATAVPGPSVIAVVNGLTGGYIGGFQVSAGGVKAMVGFDVGGDGTLELVTLEGAGRGVGLFVYNVSGGALAPDLRFAAFGTPGRAALTASGELDRTGNDDTIAEYNAEQQAKKDAEAARVAAYTVTATSDPRNGLCNCGACAALVQMAGNKDEVADFSEDLMTTVKVA
jgi:hypothetical protein